MSQVPKNIYFFPPEQISLKIFSFTHGTLFLGHPVDQRFEMLTKTKPTRGSVKVGLHISIFEANYYSISKKLVMRINISIS